MQLTSQGHNRAMVVEFRPHNILTDKFVYTLKFMGDEQTKSMRLMSKKEMIETVNARLDLKYEVTDFLTEPQEYIPCACWFVSLIKQYLYQQQMSFVSHITDPNIMNESELFQLKENYINMIIDGMDMDSLCQMAYDLLLDSYQDCTEEQMKEEILDLYDEEMLNDLMEANK